MKLDEEGFLSVDEEPEAQLGAEKVMAFAKVRMGVNECGRAAIETFGERRKAAGIVRNVAIG